MQHSLLLIKYTCFVITLLSVFAWPSQIHARPNPHTTLLKLNHGADYLNEIIDQCWLIHKDLEGFNRALFHFKHHQEEGPIKQWQPLAKPALSLATSPEFFDFSPRGNEDLLKLQALFRQYPKQLAELSSQIQTWSPKQPQSAAQLNREATKLEQQYEKIGQLVEKLRIQIQQQAWRAPLVRADDPFLQASAKLRPMVIAGRKLVQTLKSANTAQVRLAWQQFNQALIAAETSKSQWEASLPARPGSNADPMLRYEAVSQQAQDLSRLTQVYLQEQPADPYFQQQGRAYYHFNQFLVNKFSRKGQSLVDQFNRFVTLSPQAIPKEVGETNWFQAIVLPENQVAIPSATEEEKEASTHLIFLLDVSGSMRQEYKFPLFQRSFVYLMSQMQDQDQISLICYSGEAKVVTEATSPQEKVMLSQVIHSLQADGKTNLHQGLEKAYQLAEKHRDQATSHRLVLISDGGFALADQSVQLVQAGKAKAVPLSAFYMGQQEAKARPRLEHLATQGGGNYRYVQPENAVAVLLQELSASKVKK